VSEVERVLACGNKLGEGPVWSPEQQALYWVDIQRNNYQRFYPATGKHEVVEVGVAIGVLAERASGGLVMATKKGFALWDEQKHELKYIAQPFGENPNIRFNDGAVDVAGRFWAGSMADAGGELPAGVRSTALILTARCTRCCTV